MPVKKVKICRNLLHKKPEGASISYCSMEDGYQVFIMDYPLYAILNKTTYEFSFEQQKTLLLLSSILAI